MQHGLKTLTITFRNAFPQRNAVYASFFDVNAAHDRDSIKQLIKLLQQPKLPHNYLNILWKLLQCRTIRVRFPTEYSDDIEINTGVLQGRPLSFFFIFFIYASLSKTNF